MTFQKFTSEWRDSVLSLKAEATQRTLRGHIKQHIYPTFARMPIGEVTNSMVQKWVTGLRDDGLAPKTVSNLYGTLRMILAAAYSDGLISRMPKPSLPRQRRKERNWFTLPQLQALVREAGDQKPLVWLLAETGLRVGEVLGLTPESVDHKALTLTVKQSVFCGQVQATKTASSDRVLSISPWLSILLDRLEVKPYLFGGRIYRGRSRTGWPRLLAERLAPVHEAAGIVWDGFHIYRHSNRSLMAALGVPHHIAEARMGHSLRGLDGVYLHTSNGADREWCVRIADALEGKIGCKLNQHLTDASS